MIFEKFLEALATTDTPAPKIAALRKVLLEQPDISEGGIQGAMSAEEIIP